MIDNRSPLTVKIMTANPHAYEALVVAGGTPPLARELLKNVEPGQLLTAPAPSSIATGALLAGLWLWHDGLEECHSIVQNLPQATGSFWHAIMHRREGDFSNSKYWYARAGNHPALAIIAAQAGPIINEMPADRRLLRIVSRGFDPNALVDLVEEVHHSSGDPRHAVAVRLQQLEWRILFDLSE
ncbi:MAG TPA: hypothetical protein VL992_15795 [Tepidisphaeraceae bacterium]|nr:hypothetical protein [Tepidisphaeraceae bacterium]